MADIVKDTLDKNKRQDKVIFQQKKPLLNYELNLAQDILSNKINDLQKMSISNNYIGDSFKVIPNAVVNEVKIKKGIFYPATYEGRMMLEIQILYPKEEHFS